MKSFFALFFLPVLFYSCSQKVKQSSEQEQADTNFVSFTSILKIENATKDGIYINGYLVNMNYEEVKRLNGKRIKVSGEVSIIEGLKNRPKSFDDNGNLIIEQGREDDIRYIQDPVIEIIDN